MAGLDFLLDRRALIVGGLAVTAGGAKAQTVFEPVGIVTASGVRHVFQVELAITPEQKSRGLMFRREMAADRGMLFDFGPGESEATMWMRNTFIPLDMLFIRANGVIRRIAENTTPFSEATISSGGPVKGVLELNAFTCRRLGVAAGDRVEHRWFAG